MARIFSGVALLILGVLGLFLPILQGVLFIALGVIILARDIPLFARFVAWVEERFPRIGEVLRKCRKSNPPSVSK